MEMPLRKFPEHKRSFLPSKDEMKKVSKYVYAMKMGRMKTRRVSLLYTADYVVMRRPVTLCNSFQIIIRH